MGAKENSLELEAQSSKLEAHKEMSRAEAVACLIEMMRYCARDKRDIAALMTGIRQLVRRDRQMGSNRLNRLARKEDGEYRTPQEVMDVVLANPPLSFGGCKVPADGQGEEAK